MEAAGAAAKRVLKDRVSRKKDASRAFLLGDVLLYFLYEQEDEKLKKSKV